MGVPRRIYCGNAGLLLLVRGWEVFDVPSYPFVDWVSPVSVRLRGVATCLSF